jgi:hypothetical protein
MKVRSVMMGNIVPKVKPVRMEPAQEIREFVLMEWGALMIPAMKQMIHV